MNCGHFNNKIPEVRLPSHPPHDLTSNMRYTPTMARGQLPKVTSCEYRLDDKNTHTAELCNFNGLILKISSIGE